jgi:hypothetical protein
MSEDSLASDYENEYIPEDDIVITQEHRDKLRELRTIQEEKGYKDGWVFFKLCELYPRKTASYLSNLLNWR